MPNGRSGNACSFRGDAASLANAAPFTAATTIAAPSQAIFEETIRTPSCWVSVMCSLPLLGGRWQARPVTAEDFGSRAGHFDFAGGGPFQLQVATEQMRDDFAIGEPREHSGHCGGARARAAGLRLSRAPLPNAQNGLRSGDDFYEFRVDPVGKGRMTLDLRSHSEHKIVGDFVHKRHAMRVPHRHAGHPQLTARDVERDQNRRITREPSW